MDSHGETLIEERCLSRVFSDNADAPADLLSDLDSQKSPLQSGRCLWSIVWHCGILPRLVVILLLLVVLAPQFPDGENIED